MALPKGFQNSKNLKSLHLNDKTKLIILACCAVLLATLITTSLQQPDGDILVLIIATMGFSYVFFLIGIGPMFKM